MLRDLFFNIWFNESGSGWFLLVTILFCITLTILTFVIFRTKLKKETFTIKHKIFFIISALIMYQIVPASLHLTSFIKADIKLEELAIKTSMIPWQKGGYYCELATLYSMKHDYNGLKTALDEAYRYTKSYKYPCWGVHFLNFDLLGNYDAAIETALNFRSFGKVKPMYAFAAICYIKKGDFNNALNYINKEIENKGEKYSNLSLKAYILKQMGNLQEAENLYIKALHFCKNDKAKEQVKTTYTDFIGSELDRVKNAKQKYWNVE